MSSKHSIKIKTLTTGIITLDGLISKFKSAWKIVDKRKSPYFLSKFVNINRRAFEFVGIYHPSYECTDEIRIEATKYCGSVPLISPVTGKYFTTLNVEARYGEDYLGFLNENLVWPEVEFENHLSLPDSISIRPPIEHLCVRFVDAFLKFDYRKWRQFSINTIVQSFPTSGTIWSKYVLNSLDPSKVFSFPNRHNILSPAHDSFKEILFVLQLAINYLKHSRIPRLIAATYRSRIDSCQSVISEFGTKLTTHIAIRPRDSADVVEIKTFANAVLAHSLNSNIAWRFDVSKVYERYVQILSSFFSRSIGSCIFMNQKYYSNIGSFAAWTPRYLEPDIVAIKDDIAIIIDAKYKSHFYNLSSNTEELKQAFRADLHQIMAYTSLFHQKRKFAFLVYPYRTLQIHSISYGSSNLKLGLVGIPVEIDNFKAIQQEFAEKLKRIILTDFFA